MANNKSELSSLTKLYALFLLSKKGRSGYELMGEIAKISGKKPSAGQIYPLLAKLKLSGAIVVGKSGVRDKKTYTLTPKGRELVGSMMKRTDALIAELVKDKVKKCESCECLIYGNPHVKKVNGKNKYYCCPHCAAHGRMQS